MYSVHRDYVEAGSDIVYTNTFGANPLKLGDETGKIIRAAISIARKAAEGKAYVALDVGPLGKLIGEGGISFEEAYENYAAVIKAAEDKTDLIVIETMTDIADARAALLAAKENSSLPAMLSMSFEENGLTASEVDAYLATGATPVAVSVRADGYSYGASAPTRATTEFTGSNEEKLEKIMIQKWIALYPNGQEAWTEFRRTGYPKLNPVQNNRGAAQGVTTEGGIRRMVYPLSFSQSEEDRANYEEAVQKLKDKADTPASRLWWDCR